MSRARSDLPDAARAWIERLDLQPHPEGGWFRETWRHAPDGEGRGAGTAIYFLLARGEASRWHRVDAAEIWHWYDGAPLVLQVSSPDVSPGATEVRTLRLGIGEDALPQRVVPPGAWQAAHSEGEFTLVGCTVSPAFEFDHFELAPPGWVPGDG